MWLIFLCLHLIGLVGYNLVLRKSLVEKLDRWTLATVMQTAIALPMVFVMFISLPDIHTYTLNSVLMIGATIALVIALHTTNVLALQKLEASVYSILYNLRIVITTILGIVFLSEKILPLQILGGLLIFLAVVTVRQKGSESLSAKGFKWGLLAALVISFLNLFEKILIKDIGYLEYAMPVMVITATLMWIVLFIKRKKVSIKYFKEPRTIQLMIFRALSAYGFTLAFYAGGLLSVSSYISSLSVIIMVILGVWLLKERDYLDRKVLATILAFLGLTAILVANLNN